MELQKLIQAVMEGDASAALGELEAQLEASAPPLTLINEGLLAAMEQVGRLFKQGELFIPEVVMSAETVKGCLARLKPLLPPAEADALSTVAIGTVKGDLHDIGKNLVAMMLESSGFKVIDLGTDVSPQAFVQAACRGAGIIAMSALLTTTMPSMKETVAALTEAGWREKIKVIIGGAPVSAQYARAIGADGYSEDAASAVELCKSLINNTVNDAMKFLYGKADE
ncbi:MAG: corrinoid protein [Clostridiales bacterium]|nr:corrinoid protein [Clostridiales bacterium]